MSTRIGLSFHETFPLNRSAMLQLIEVAGQNDGRISRSSLRKHTSLGTNYIKAMPRYGVGCGIFSGSELTPFGQVLLQHDPTLASDTTQWLMHYHMSAPHGPGPCYWHHLVTHFLRAGNRLSSTDVASEIIRTIRNDTGSEPNPRTVGAAATVFLRSYAKPEGFCQLRLIQEVERGLYLVTDPSPVPVWVFGFALVDYWEHRWGDRITVDLAALFEPGGLSSIFFLGSEAVDELLGTLQREKLIDVYRVAPPYQVVRQWGQDARQMCLDRAYASN